ncbi:phosphogluconate dehydrogenase [Nocardia nova]|uniref:Phosphogluconate dehydrogenase n=1 Tax=Nocardia nova TaxID=37330 RepID=A0A2S6AMJ7_9NOCA|nr:NAD(P)-binding domain-containing protein [Nocardia nova]PPJ36423.1 phosphogluconate dehydrogenase [Nocardia nova]
MIIGLLHPGAMGAAVGARLVAAGYTVLWHTENRSDATRKRADDAKLTPCDSLAHLLRSADVVISICPSAAAQAVAEEVSRHKFTGVYVDANAVSPRRMESIAGAFEGTGIDVVDAVISGPPPTADASPKIFLSGSDHAIEQVGEPLEDSGFTVDVLSETIGRASALKMALISYQRPARLLAALAHGLADQHGITDALIAEASRIGADVLADRDALPSVAARAWRWEPEAHEVATSLAEYGLPDDFANTAARLFQLLAVYKDNPDIAPEDVIKRLAF